MLLEVALTVMPGAAMIPESERVDPAERQETMAEVARRSEDVLRAHRDGDPPLPMANYVAVARA